MFESAIPLILIAILAVFVAGKFGLVDFSGVPILSSIFPAPTITVGVVGSASQSMVDLLSTEEYHNFGISYAGSIDQSNIYSGVLNNFNIVILQGEAVCDRTARMAIANYVKGGGKLIVIQDACTRVSNDASAYGWNIGIGSLGDVMPVTIGGIAHQYEPWQTVPVQGELKIVNVNDPIFNGVDNFQFDSTITAGITPTPTSQVDAFVDSSSIGQQTAPSLYAIIESQGLLTGKVIYFAYDPSTMAVQGVGSNLFLNTLLYLRGAKG